MKDGGASFIDGTFDLLGQIMQQEFEREQRRRAEKERRRELELETKMRGLSTVNDGTQSGYQNMGSYLSRLIR